MKIAFFVNEFPALSETFILNQITGLLDRGHKVDIYAYRAREDPTVHADVERYHLLKHLVYMAVDAFMPRNKLYRIIKALGHIAIDLSKKPKTVLNALNPLKFGKEAISLRLLYQISPFLDKGPYDIVHCHFGPTAKVAITLKAVGAIQGKIVTTFYGYDISSYVQKNGKHIYETIFEQGDLFLCVGEQMKEELIKLGCNKNKIFVHRLGVNVKSQYLNAEKPKTSEKVHLLTIARLVEKKGVSYAIQSVAKVLRKYPHIEYTIAGDGYLREPLQRLMQQLEVKEKINLLGWQSQDQITELLRASDILLAPSVTGQNGDREGTPVVIIEALAQGLPVISTRHSGIPEIIQDEETGLLVPERDSDALAEKLEYLIEHRERWHEMGQKGRKYIEQNYNIDLLNDRLIEIYQQLLSGHPTE